MKLLKRSSIGRHKRKIATKMDKKDAKPVFCLAVVLIVAANVFILCNSIGFGLVEARYLPTRSDDTEIAVLKEIIRNILTKTRFEQMDSDSIIGQQQPQNHLHQQAPRTATVASNGQSLGWISGHQISRRSGGELAQSLSNGDESFLKSMISDTESHQKQQPFGYPNKLDR